MRELRTSQCHHHHHLLLLPLLLESWLLKERSYLVVVAKILRRWKRCRAVLP
jgi:hypothetical protein